MYPTRTNGNEEIIKFTSKKEFLSILIKLEIEKKDKIIIIRYIVTILSFEKYNTKCNYFFVSVLFIKP